MAVAVFAGGCFWCLEPPLRALVGVIHAEVGYTGGDTEDPTYEEVSSGETGHYEAIRVRYEPALVPYARLLEVFWRQIDPFDFQGQFADRGPQYQTAIFYADEEQRRLAEASKRAVEQRFKRPVATRILPLQEFWPAEDYHQRYAEKHPVRYNAYKVMSGRATTTKELWGQKP